MPIDTAPEGAELLHQPVVKPFPEFSPKTPHQAQDAGSDGHNHDYDAAMQQGVSTGSSTGTGQKPGLGSASP
ncbi:hypothetical protein SAMN05216350_107107 [Polaromonas sp. YR568]|uniref:hypothetical protein n=1 Tax=Polaromonas sp. YR568 TaxID=1855301 RepID=UPI0008E2F805|nr:hypothetical protein [Polaromonas sp. YR568]SFU88663.1 hypothetical protein SAMN05216350_107107 [Polaromonas sp. YR568]